VNKLDNPMTALGQKRLQKGLWIFTIFVVLLLMVYQLIVRLGLEPWSIRKLRFAIAAHRSEKLITAIHTYQQERGAPPDSLAALVPHYVAKIPRTGLAGHPDFEYQRFTNSQYSLIWYDLGSRNGLPKAGLWAYPEGDPEHAILAFTIDQSGRVVAARADRMPTIHQTNAFDAQLWRSNLHRIEMVQSLPKAIQLPGTDTNTVVALLGPAEGFRVLRDSPWQLTISCPWGFLNWDVFFYWPTQNYPGGFVRLKEAITEKPASVN
jgi:hypothetical protein